MLGSGAWEPGNEARIKVLLCSLIPDPSVGRLQYTNYMCRRSIAKTAQCWLFSPINCWMLFFQRSELSRLTWCHRTCYQVFLVLVLQKLRSKCQGTTILWTNHACSQKGIYWTAIAKWEKWKITSLLPNLLSLTGFIMLQVSEEWARTWNNTRNKRLTLLHSNMAVLHSTWLYFTVPI